MGLVNFAVNVILLRDTGTLSRVRWFGMAAMLFGWLGGCRHSSAGRWVHAVMWDYKGLVPSSSLEPQQSCLHRHFLLLVGHWVGLGEVAGGLCLLEKLWYLCRLL